MPGMSNTTEDAVINLIFRATAWANYADNAAGTPETNIVVALHTGTLDDTSVMNTTEAAYSSYARVNVLRSTGWTASSGGATFPAAQIDFPAGTGGSGTVTNFAVGKSGGGASPILFYGTVVPSIVTGSAVTPHLTVATSISID